jgi:hypothetical protein
MHDAHVGIAWPAAAPLLADLEEWVDPAPVGWVGSPGHGAHGSTIHRNRRLPR